jgi:hypothetical protein
MLEKTELINDLVACATVMEELWKYHPENPLGLDIKVEFDALEDMKAQIELELMRYE